MTEKSQLLHGNQSDHYQKLLSLSATGRFTSTVEAGKAIAAMALDLTNVTGTVLVCDGGQSIAGNHSLS